MKQPHRVVESIVNPNGQVTTKTYQGNLTPAKARALADKLNTAQDFAPSEGAPILVYHHEASH